MIKPLHLAVRSLAPTHVLDFWATRFSPAWSLARPMVRLVDRQVASSDAMTLTLRANRHWAGFQPGQHANLGAELDGRRVTRSYSLSKVSGRKDCVSITVKAVAGGQLSQHLCEHAKIGDFFEIGPAFGGMLVPEVVQSPRLFLAAGSGITPLMAMTRELAARGMPAPVTLLYWTRVRSERCFVPELRALTQRYPQFQVRFLLTREAALDADEFEGRIDAASVAAAVDDMAAREVFACGPAGFVESARALVATQARSFMAEAFSPPVPVAADERGTVKITLAKSGKVLEIPRDRSLLTALEAQGLAPASGCRMGICNTCACPKPSGATRNLLTGDTEAEPVSALRLCVNSATSDLVLEL